MYNYDQIWIRVETCPSALLLLDKKDITESICKRAISFNGDAIRYIPKNLITDELCLESYKTAPIALQFMKEQPYNLCLESVKKDGKNILHIRNRTYEICLEAVKSNPLSFMWVNTELQTAELCEIAIQNMPKKDKSFIYVHMKDEFRLMFKHLLPKKQ